MQQKSSKRIVRLLPLTSSNKRTKCSNPWENLINRKKSNNINTKPLMKNCHLLKFARQNETRKIPPLPFLSSFHYESKAGLQSQ